MFEQLRASQGKNVALELVDGRIVSGTVLVANEQYVRIETMEGIGSIPIKSIQIVWEPAKQSLTEKSMERLAEELRDSVKAEIGCTGPQYGCSQQVYGAVGPLASVGGCPAVNCGAFQHWQSCACQYQQPCMGQYQQPYDPQYSQSCVCMYQQPCGTQYTMPCVCMYQQPCDFQYAQQPCVCMYQQPCAAQYAQPCGSAFSQPCATFQFQQPCCFFSFNAAQCAASSRYNCTGPFTAATDPAVETAVGVAPVSSPLPMDFAVKEEQKNKDEKEKE